MACGIVDLEDIMARRSPGPFRLLVDLDRASPGRALVGGKGASLSHLLALGAPVPDACALTTDAYRTVAVSLGLPGRVSDATPFDLPWIRAELLHGPLPAAVSAAISDAWNRMAAGVDGELALAVRSSATSEDSGEHSFAGLHDTVLDIRSPETLDAAVRACWASLWSDRAVSYRQGTSLVDEPAEIAVVVQRLVRADVAFVVFTADPVSGNADHAVITASWGLGEAIVAGLVTPDHVIVDPAGNVVQYTVGAKEVMTVAGATPGEGTREVTVPRLLRSVPVLTNDQAAEIAALARSLAGRLGYLADIEGGIAGGAIHLFQARPITTLGAAPWRPGAHADAPIATGRDPVIVPTPT
jgi:rifampicin phosphotransferase